MLQRLKQICAFIYVDAVIEVSCVLAKPLLY